MSSNIICGDCISVMKEMPSGSVDCVMTSPPYNMTKRKGGNADTGKYDVYVDWKDEEEYLSWSADIFNAIDNVLVQNGVVAYNFSYSIENPSLPYKLVAYIENNTDFVLVDTIVWKKKSGLPFPANEKRLSRLWEYVFVFARASEIDTFNIYKGISSVGSNGQKYYNVVYNYIEAKNNNGKTPFNQATFSTELVDFVLSLYAKAGDTILDPFNGTGTTGVSCVGNKMDYVGIELSEKQCEYSRERIEGFVRA